MMGFATALAKKYDQVLPFLEEQKMDVWTHNKTIQKVTLPTVQRSALSSAGETAGVVPFTIDLTSCLRRQRGQHPVHRSRQRRGFRAAGGKQERGSRL